MITTETLEVKNQPIQLEGINPVAVLGAHDAHLALVQQAYPEARITARGSEIKVTGNLSDFREIRDVFSELIDIVRRTGILHERDVLTVLTIVSSSHQRMNAGEMPPGVEPDTTDRKPVAKGKASAKRTGKTTKEAIRDSVDPAGFDDPMIEPLAGGLPKPGDSDVIVYTQGGGAVRAKTPGQQRIVESHKFNDIVFAIGPAGTGKTYTAVALAVKALKERRVKRIVLCRPAVEAGESLGFLPGDLKDKIDPYLRPLYDSLEEMIDHDRLELNITKNIIEIAPLAYMRGRTLNNAFVILDEAQNATTVQMKMFLTRLGINSSAIVTGDITQTDLPRKMNSGLVEIPKILKNIKGIDFVYLDQGDVVRHKLIRDIIEAYERYEDQKSQE